MCVCVHVHMCASVCAHVYKRTWIWLALDTKKLAVDPIYLLECLLAHWMYDVVTLWVETDRWLELSEAKRESNWVIQKWWGRTSLKDPKTEAAQFHSPCAPSWFQLSPRGCRHDTRPPHTSLLIIQMFITTGMIRSPCLFLWNNYLGYYVLG